MENFRIAANEYMANGTTQSHFEQCRSLNVNVKLIGDHAQHVPPRATRLELGLLQDIFGAGAETFLPFFQLFEDGGPFPRTTLALPQGADLVEPGGQLAA